MSAESEYINHMFHVNYLMGISQDVLNNISMWKSNEIQSVQLNPMSSPMLTASQPIIPQSTIQPITQSMPTQPITQSMSAQPITQPITPPITQSMPAQPITQSMSSPPITQSMPAQPITQQLVSIITIKNEEEKEGENYYVYLLQSISNPRKTYIGYTINPIKRLRQHNGEIVGGAKRTKSARPWRMICYLTGFQTSKIALQFEWLNNHPKKMGLTQRNSVKGRIQTIYDGLKRARFASTAPLTSSMKLQLIWLVHEHQ